MWSGGSRVDPRWRSGRSPATPDRLYTWETTPLRPTLQHIGRLVSHITSISFAVGLLFPANGRVLRWVGRAGRSDQRSQDGVQTDPLHAELQFAGPARSLLRCPEPPARSRLPPARPRARRLWRRCKRRRRRRSGERGPGRHLDLFPGRGAPRGRPARRRARRRRQGPAHRRPRAQDPRTDRQGPRRLRRREGQLREGLRAVARREGRACGSPASTAPSPATS